MRIAQVMLAKDFGGAERSFVDLSQVLAARGHRVLAIGEERGVALTRLAPQANIEAVALRCRGSWDVFAARAIKRELDRFGPDVVQLHLARAAYLGGSAARALGIPALAKTHNLVDLKYYRDIDMLVPTTQAQVEYLRAHGVAPAKMCLIPNFSAIASVPVLAPPSAAPTKLVALGRLVHKKGFDVLLHAFALLAADGFDGRLVIGGDGPERAALERAVATLGLGARAELRGWVDDVVSFLADCDLFVLPSRDEPFGIVLLEAMARGIPIVSTPTAGPRAILDSDSAWFTEGDDAASLARAIKRALGDPAARAERAQNALRRFTACYSAATVVTRYLDLYAQLRNGAAD